MPTVLGVLAEQRHWMPRDGVREFEDMAREIGETEIKSISERQWERWCSGELKGLPQPPARRVLEAMFGYPVEELLSIKRDGRPPNPAACNTDNLKGIMGMAARKARDLILVAESANVGAETLEQIREDLIAVARDYLREPLPALLPDLIDLQDVVFRLLDNRQPPAQLRDLYLYSGVLSGMLAKASHDLGNPRWALTHARLAHVCAVNAGHIGLQGWTRGLQSLIAYWAEWPHDAVRYARMGYAEAPSLTSTTAAWLPALEARALARMGQVADARQALARARAARERVAPDELDEIGGLLTFSQPREMYYAAETAIQLPGFAEQAERDAAAAVVELERAGLANSPEASFSDLAGARSDLALARVRRGQIDGAREALRPVLDLPPDQRIGGIVPSAMRVNIALREPELAGPLAQDLREEIEVFARHRALSLPG